MRTVAQRIAWIIGLVWLAFGAAGLFAFSPVTTALAVAGWFLCRGASDHLKHQSDIHASTPDLQYWARSLILQTVGLMALGAVIALGMVASGVAFHLSVHTQTLLTIGLICLMVVVGRLTLPSFFAASWQLHKMRSARKMRRSSPSLSRFIVRTVAVMMIATSLVGSFSFLQSIRLGAPRYSQMARMAKVVSYTAPQAVEEMFSPSETSAR